MYRATPHEGYIDELAHRLCPTESLYRKRAWKVQAEEDPYVVIGSQACNMFCTWQNAMKSIKLHEKLGVLRRHVDSALFQLESLLVLRTVCRTYLAVGLDL